MPKTKPWIAEHKLYFLVAILLIWIMAVRLPLDSDMWWHLRAGQETIRNRAVYQVDTFSHTRAGEAWLNHSWLSQVVMAGIQSFAGFSGLSIWVGLCAVISMALVYARMEAHPLTRSAVLLLAATVSSVVWSPRPQIMSLVLLALVSYLIHQFHQEGKPIFAASLPLVFVFWGNLHGGYVLGLLYIGAVLIGRELDKVINPNQEEDFLSPAKWSWLFAAGLACGFAVLINPFGMQLWKIPFSTVGIETLQNMIDEWASPDFHQLFQQPFLVMLLGMMGIFAFSSRKVPGRILLPGLLFSWAALTARRNFGPFAIVAAPLVADYGQVVLEDWSNLARKSWPAWDRFLESAEKNKGNFSPLARNVINVSLLILLALAGIIKAVDVNTKALFSEKEAELFPAEAAEWLQDTSEPLTIFNDYNWGGYLIYRAPDRPVFVDGRTDLFGDEILEDYLKVMGGGKGWSDILAGYGVNTMVLRADARLMEAAQFQDWQIVYRDELAVILKK